MQKKSILSFALVVALYVVIYFLRRAGVITTYWGLILDLALITTISAVGLSLIYGFAGQFSLGHAAFYGVGAYVGAFITKAYGGTPLNFVLGLIAGTLAAALIGFLIGLPILRLRSDYLGIATLGFGVIVKVLFDNSDKISKLLGGSMGMMGIPRITTFTWVFWCAVLVIWLARNLINSSHGLACISVREDEIAADIMGIDTTRFKMLAFTLGCGMAGLGGGLYAHLYSFLHPSNFFFLKSFDVLLIVVLGGLGSLTGTVVAAIGVVFLQEILRDVLGQQFLEWRGVVYALALIVLMILRPQGLMGGWEFSLDRLFVRRPKGGNARGAA
ncbi:branched-chain amino acid transport system permease protein [Symbiobacterium terraclitae]|uniref:Branched-chain amino acid transport system permease protein n=1 Tax=Symbiobacterium terraclitae TaxID=557451 RepID=A0ABS4JQG4_9FIRM|nr:branched-chain amino acid ABC transporter permease [Symbiobacterium terraclitae]MBP2017783.1 branched-chain amino acid transport system permease protein [Symbiobacterium terraclitae]